MLPMGPAGQMAEISLGDIDGDTVILPPPPPPEPEVEAWEQHAGRQGTTAAGGLAGAIAALAERQAVGGPAPAPAAQPTRSTAEGARRPVAEERRGEQGASRDADAAETGAGGATDSRRQRGEAGQRAGRDDEAENASRASEKLANWVSSTQREYKGASAWHGDQSSEQVEVGTSFASSVPSASELPWEAPELPAEARSGESSGGASRDKVLVPDSFEEQMMLAVALSLADAQARGRAGRSGPLPRSTTSPMGGDGHANSRSGPLPTASFIGH